MSNIVPAVPSYVIPADVQENVRFLAEKHSRSEIGEIALLCFEPSLPDTDKIKEFQGTWHIHLPYAVPLDFYENPQKYLTVNPVYSEQTEWKDCWKHAKSAKDTEQFAKACIQIFRHCKDLAPHACVMHLPNKDIPQAETLLDCFLQTWKKELPLGLLCLENVRNASYFDYEGLILSTDCSLCFDAAHALTYGQQNCLERNAFMNKVKIVHWSAPFDAEKPEYGKDRHLGLNHLKKHTDYCIQVVKSTAPHAVHVLEIFSWEEIEKSQAFFKQLFV